MNPASTSRILQLTPAESRHVLDLLFGQITRPEYTLRWRWQAGDLAMWDNTATAHLAATDLAGVDEPRTMYRITILGDLPIGPTGTRSACAAGEAMGPFADSTSGFRSPRS